MRSEELIGGQRRSEEVRESQRRSERSGPMQTCCLSTEGWAVSGLGGTPVTQRGLSSLAVSEPVGDGEPRVSLQLRQNHQHLPEREKRSLSAVHPSSFRPDGAANLCRGGMLSMALRLPRVDTTLKLSLQSHDTWR